RQVDPTPPSPRQRLLLPLPSPLYLQPTPPLPGSSSPSSATALSTSSSLRNLARQAARSGCGTAASWTGGVAAAATPPLPLHRAEEPPRDLCHCWKESAPARQEGHVRRRREEGTAGEGGVGRPGARALVGRTATASVTMVATTELEGDVPPVDSVGNEHVCC
ncbi:unnamed protein product, partial [Urochloa humidicola]